MFIIDSEDHAALPKSKLVEAVGNFVISMGEKTEDNPTPVKLPTWLFNTPCEFMLESAIPVEFSEYEDEHGEEAASKKFYVMNSDGDSVVMENHPDLKLIGFPRKLSDSSFTTLWVYPKSEAMNVLSQFNYE